MSLLLGSYAGLIFHGGGGQVSVHQNKKDEINLCFL